MNQPMPRTLLAVDPGIDTGWCLVDLDGSVLSCGLGGLFPGAGFAVLERPHVYRASKSKGDPNDLITLAIQLGRYVERLEARGTRCTLVEPATWKGQVPKSIHHQRILQSLPSACSAAVRRGLEGVSPGKEHNVLDAVGLALWGAKNLARYRTKR